MKSNTQLPYTTDNHEFTISWDKTKATIFCKFKNEAEAFDNPITLDEFKEMILTASNKEIKTIDFKTNYGIDVHRHTWKEIGKKYGIKITKTSI